MGKKDTKVSDGTLDFFPELKSYSIDEIMAAGGTTAFANKTGKTAKALMDRLKEIPKEDFRTEEEGAEARKTRNQSK